MSNNSEHRLCCKCVQPLIYTRKLSAQIGIRMKASDLLSAVFGMIGKVIVTILVVYVIYQGAMKCYDYGYRIFTEPAVSSGEGVTVSVTVTEEMSALDMGDLFAQKGLVKDANLFALQYLLSEYKQDFKPGTYDLSTAMTAEEMMKVMATDTEEEE